MSPSPATTDEMRVPGTGPGQIGVMSACAARQQMIVERLAKAARIDWPGVRPREAAGLGHETIRQFARRGVHVKDSRPAAVHVFVDEERRLQVGQLFTEFTDERRSFCGDRPIAETARLPAAPRRFACTRRRLRAVRSRSHDSLLAGEDHEGICGARGRVPTVNPVNGDFRNRTDRIARLAFELFHEQSIEPRRRKGSSMPNRLQCRSVAAGTHSPVTG